MQLFHIYIIIGIPIVIWIIVGLSHFCIKKTDNKKLPKDEKDNKVSGILLGGSEEAKKLHDINKLRTGVLDLVLESSARKIGDIGEDKLYLALRNKINIPDNQILRNVYIPTHNGKTTEIDMIVVSKKGLLVFECKNYSGRIYGNMYSKQWTQYVGKKKYPVPNPFMQNHYHVKCLQEYLKQLAAYQLYRSCQQTRAENGRYTIWAQTIIFSARTVL